MLSLGQNLTFMLSLELNRLNKVDKGCIIKYKMIKFDKGPSPGCLRNIISELVLKQITGGMLIMVSFYFYEVREGTGYAMDDNKSIYLTKMLRHYPLRTLGTRISQRRKYI